MRRTPWCFRGLERGGTAAEYALLAALITLAIFAAVTALGINVEALFSNDDLLNALST